jgi:hypothetical protein
MLFQRHVQLSKFRVPRKQDLRAIAFHDFPILQQRYPVESIDMAETMKNRDYRVRGCEFCVDDVLHDGLGFPVDAIQSDQ